MNLSAAIGAVFSGMLLSLPAEANHSPKNVVNLWNDALLQAIRETNPGPTVAARSLAIVNTSMYDAWSAYEPKPIGTRLGDTLQRPVEENILSNKNMAISYGAYRALVDLFPSRVGLFNNVMTQLGYVPNNYTDTTKPDGIGNVAAQALLYYRHSDGSNQLAGYADNTGYSPVNTPDTITNPNLWQPLKVSDGQNGYKIQNFLTPHWGQVVPFALSSGSELRPPAPNRFQPNKYDGTPGPSGGYVQQIRKLIQISADLTEREKVIAEYWADGPSSELPPGHWIVIGQYVSNRDHHDLDQDVKMFFALSNAMLDSSIATWEAKRFYDYSRPITQIRFMFNGQRIRAWGGPYQGTKMVDGEKWLPYQPLTVVTPPFAEYVSGHSTFSAAGAEILKRFTGSDFFGASHTQPAGSSRVEPNAVPAAPVTLSWKTFTEAADEAGMSRRYGGIHIEDGDMAGRALGRQVAAKVWDKTASYINSMP